MRFLLCGYREWAWKVFDRLNVNHQEHRFEVVLDTLHLEDAVQRHKYDAIDAIIIVGWSWKVPAGIVNSTVCVGMHPSDLPRYSGGSPIQHQIMEGVTQTNATLFRLNERFDDGRVIDKQPIDLRGHLDDVLNSIADATTVMLERFIESFPNFTEKDQSEFGDDGFTVRRLKPEQSRLTKEQLSALSVRQLWDAIRCREDPYPNVFFEDETGKLTIKHVEFEPKEVPR